MTAQDHFSGIKIQMDSACSSMNPAELSNLNSKYEINFSQQVLMLQIIR
jgi:hypothetical protein